MDHRKIAVPPGGGGIRNVYLYPAMKLICNRIIHGFESVCLLRLICRAVFIGAWSSSNDIRFRFHG
jgi:hypothetical protein